MATMLTKDARGFVDGVVSYLQDDKRSKSAAPKVAALLTKVSAAAKKQKVARVETSVALTAEEKADLARVLAKFLGHDVELEVTVNADVLGGFRISVGDWVVDTSLASSLAQMAQSLQNS